MRPLLVIVTVLCFSIIHGLRVWALPTFYFSGLSDTGTNLTYTVNVNLNTDGSTVTAAQTVINFDNVYLQAKSLSILNSRCSFWSPADPSLGYGITPAPYFYPSTSSNKAVIACGFSNPGYQSASPTGDLIAKISFTPLIVGTTSLSFDSASTLFRFIGSSINPGTMTTFPVDIALSATASAAPTLTPTPSATPSATQVATSSAATPTPAVDKLTKNDLNFVEISVNKQADSGTQSENVVLQVVDEDDTIPNPPNLEPRAPATPFVFKLLNSVTGGGGEQGEVLAAQSLRELLIPGRSNADKTVVLINLISTVTFLVLLGVVLWRLLTITRMNKLKSQHMKELLASELAVLESKLGTATDKDSTAQLRQEIDEALEKIKNQ